MQPRYSPNELADLLVCHKVPRCDDEAKLGRKGPSLVVLPRPMPGIEDQTEHIQINGGKGLIEQARDFYQAISSNKKDLYIFTMENDGSDDHCQIDNRTSANRVIFDWLDELFKEGKHA